ncbi:MAG TPA: hypothetical protein VJT54_04890, partial [Verrucomicrobiae bacterium]|nr:hypothetical protein [Verrucomicrobiae bacterium]
DLRRLTSAATHFLKTLQGSDANTIPDGANLWSFGKSGEGYNGFVFGFFDCEFQFQIQHEGQDVLVRVRTAGQVGGDVERDMASRKRFSPGASSNL